MYSFFILGQIPGTSIQISFQVWLFLCAVALVVYIKLRPRIKLFFLEVEKIVYRRRPLHASRLHQRAI